MQIGQRLALAANQPPRVIGFHVEQKAVFELVFLGVVLRVASDARRAHRRKSPHAHGEGPVDPETVADEGALGAEDHAARREGAALLSAMLEELDEDKRAVFVLAELEGLSMPAIAEALGLNVNTAYARLRAARQDFERAVARAPARDGWRVR